MLEIKSSELILNLNEMIKKYAGNDRIRKVIVDQFTQRNMKASLAVNILNERLLLSTLDINNANDLILLFVFSTGMYQAITEKEKEINPSNAEITEILKLDPIDYFTEIEMENLKDYKLQKKEKGKEEEVIFPNMIQLAPNFWVGGISSIQLADLDAENEFIYNFKTQRDPVFDVYGTKKINFSKTKAKEISERLLSGKQFPDAIVINVLKNGEDDISYEKNGDLVIHSGVKNIVDGMHRKVGNGIYVSQNPNASFNFILIVTNYSEARAQDQMSQINKQKPMKIEHTKNLDSSKLGNAIIDSIRDIRTSEFAKLIRDSDDELKYNGITKKYTLSVAVTECYKSELTNSLQTKNIAEHIANVMDLMIGLYVNEFIKNPKESKKTSFINHKNMFIGYIALSAKLYKNVDWENKVEEALSKVDFSKSNPFWKDNDILDNDVKKSSRSNFYKLFQNL